MDKVYAIYNHPNGTQYPVICFYDIDGKQTPDLTIAVTAAINVDDHHLEGIDLGDHGERQRFGDLH